MLILDIDKSRKRNLCEDIICWFVSKYLNRFTIEIVVEHKNLKNDGVLGYCGIIGSTYRPREFLIEIHNRLNGDDYIKILLHELHHVHQHIRGDLKNKKGINYWKGIDCSHLNYEELPWEIDARKKEEELYEEYQSYLT